MPKFNSIMQNIFFSNITEAIRSILLGIICCFLLASCKTTQPATTETKTENTPEVTVAATPDEPSRKIPWNEDMRKIKIEQCKRDFITDEMPEFPSKQGLCSCIVGKMEENLSVEEAAYAGVMDMNLYLLVCVDAYQTTDKWPDFLKDFWIESCKKSYDGDEKEAGEVCSCLALKVETRARFAEYHTIPEEEIENYYNECGAK